jgi:hypothetical protein
MIKLSTFASLCRKHDVDFKVKFTNESSFVVVQGNATEWDCSDENRAFTADVFVAGGRFRGGDRFMRMELESLT